MFYRQNPLKILVLAVVSICKLIGMRFSSVAGERSTNPLDNGVSVVKV